jgi:transcriptional regulator with XRE-family HTH domain
MANTTPSELGPLALTTLITSRRQELGLTRAQFVKRAGYKNEAKGIRRLEGLLAGEVEASKSLIRGLPSALDLPANRITHAVEETRRQIEQAQHRAAQEEQAAWRASFKPHAIILTERQWPEPIFVAAMIGVARLLHVNFDSDGDRASYVQKALQGMQWDLAKWNGVVPAFGRPTGIVINYTSDRAIRFDLDGIPHEFFSQAYRIGQGHLLMKGRPIPAEVMPRVVLGEH